MGRLMEESRILVPLVRGPAPSWARLDFTMQDQKQTLWCWAATTVSVSAYYDPETDWTQCALVNAERGLTTCCDDGSTEECDQVNVLDAPLRRADVLHRKERGSVTYHVIRQEIDAGRPLAFRVRWSGGGGHFAVIEGYQSSGDTWIAIDDPDPGYSAVDLPVSTLTGGTYRGTGSWTHTYFTRPQSHRPLAPDEIRRASGIREVPVEEAAFSSGDR
jgi:Papain-like cysteine protease AvrRpt2